MKKSFTVVTVATIGALCACGESASPADGGPTADDRGRNASWAQERVGSQRSDERYSLELPVTQGVVDATIGGRSVPRAAHGEPGVERDAQSLVEGCAGRGGCSWAGARGRSSQKKNGPVSGAVT